MTVTSNITNITLAEAADAANWDDLGGGQGSGQDTGLPIQGIETRSRRVDNAIRGFGYDNNATIDISASGTHVGFWANVLQPGQIGATQGLQFCISDSGTGSKSGNWNGYNFDAVNYPVEGGWQRVWVDPTRTRDAGSGTLALTGVQGYGCEFDVGDVGGNAPNCHLDRIDYSSAGLAITAGSVGTPTKFADAVTTDATNAYGIINANFLNGPIEIGGTATVFRDANFAIKAGNQPLAAADWIRIDINLTSGSEDIVLGGYFLEGIPFVPNGTSGTANLGTGTLLNTPAMVFNSAITFAGKLSSSGQLTWGGADIAGTTFEESSAAVSLLCNTNLDLNNLTDNCSFISDGSNHAIELGSNTPSTITLTGHSYSQYAGVDGSSGNEVIYNNSGKSITINVNGGDVPTIRNGSGASTTVNAGNVTWTIEVVDSNGAAVQNAEVTVTDQAATPNELYHLENTPSSGLAAYSFPVGNAGNSCTILVLKTDPDAKEPFSLDTVLPSGNTTTTVQMSDDRTENNP